MYDFDRVDATLIQHVPVLRETWVLSFRGDMKTTLGDDSVPYFLLPSLGSGSTLRAYHSWRFRDRHSLLMSGEFRWIPSRLGMDMAIFYDAGKVASRRRRSRFRRARARLGRRRAAARAAPRRRSASRSPGLGRLAPHFFRSGGLLIDSREFPPPVRWRWPSCLRWPRSPRSRVRGAGPKFYRRRSAAARARDAERSKVAPRDVDLIPDLLLHMFTKRGDPAPNVRAKNINTIDEVPDSSWFTNRIYAHDLTVEQVVEGQIADSPPAPGRWTLIRPKSAGFSPGFTEDSKGGVWFLSFDPKGYPQASTAAVAVATRLFWALGYKPGRIVHHAHRSEADGYRPEGHDLAAPGQAPADPPRRSRGGAAAGRADADGTYRAVAGRLLPGKVVGPFKYYGTRRDDPNDIVPHEHRRSLRALKVFGAWTNLVDMKAGNTLDTRRRGKRPQRRQALPAGRRLDVRHRRQRAARLGRRVRVPVGAGFDAEAALSFGFALSPWQTVPYQELPRSAGSRATNSTRGLGAASADAGAAARQG